MTPPSWNHGYFTDDVYTAGFFREMAPNWLDFAALVQGAAPPRQREGEPFRYLDLGCGMGFAIALLAALYPEGEFVGIDFLPHHIAHGRGLARRLGLSNLQLLEADLLDLKGDPDARRALLGAEPFHYVVSHGVATWVVEPVQQALLAVASASLGPGPLVELREASALIPAHQPHCSAQGPPAAGRPAQGMLRERRHELLRR